MADSVDTQATAASEQDTKQQQEKSFTQEEVNELMGKLRRETKDD